MPSGVMPHCQPCLLVWSLTIGHAVWRDASLSAMSAVVVPRYRPCLLMWWPTIDQACWSNATTTDIFTNRVQMEEGWLQVWCYLYRGDITSDMPADLVQLLDMPACTVQL